MHFVDSYYVFISQCAVPKRKSLKIFKSVIPISFEDSFIVTLGCGSSTGYPWPREVSFKIYTVKYFETPAALYPLLTNSDHTLFLDCHIPLFKGERTINFEKITALLLSAKYLQ